MERMAFMVLRAVFKELIKSALIDGVINNIVSYRCQRNFVLQIGQARNPRGCRGSMERALLCTFRYVRVHAGKKDLIAIWCSYTRERREGEQFSRDVRQISLFGFLPPIKL